MLLYLVVLWIKKTFYSLPKLLKCCCLLQSRVEMLLFTSIVLKCCCLLQSQSKYQNKQLFIENT